MTLNSEPVLLGTATADAAGVARMSATIPANTALGAHTIVAQGTGVRRHAADAHRQHQRGGGRRLGHAARVGRLPRTGDDSSLPLARIGLALAAVGGVITAVAAKRRKATAAA